MELVGETDDEWMYTPHGRYDLRPSDLIEVLGLSKYAYPFGTPEGDIDDRLAGPQHIRVIVEIQGEPGR